MIDTPPMRPALRRFVDWVAGYTLSPPGEVMAMALRVVASGRSARRRPAGGAADPLPEARLTEARRKVLDALAAREPRATGELARAAGVGAGVVRGMADAGLLVPAVLPVEPPFAIPDPEHPGQILSPDQGSRRRACCGRRWRRGTFPSRCWTA